MSFLDIAAAAQNARPESCVEEGEYKVRIITAKMDSDKGYLLIRLELVDEPFAKEVSVMLNLPGSGRNAKEENRNTLKLVSFYECFGLDIRGQYVPEETEPTGFVNREGWVLLTGPVDDGKGYGEQNRVKWDGFIPRR